MRTFTALAGATALLSTTLSAQLAPINAAKVHEDARVLQRVLEVSKKKELPRDAIKTIAQQDLDMLRGPKGDGSFAWASYERADGGTVSEGFTVASGEKQTAIRYRGEKVHKLTVQSPSRRYLVRRNHGVLIEQIVMDITPLGSSPSRVETIEVNELLAPGQKKVFELPEIAAVARVTLTARTEKGAGTGGLELTFTKAKLIDDSRSPYASAVSNLKTLLERLEKNDQENLHTLASLLAADPMLQPRPVETAAALRMNSGETSSMSDIYTELQSIEDLLTGSPSEREEGMAALHQLVRKLRPQRY